MINAEELNIMEEPTLDQMEDTEQEENLLTLDREEDEQYLGETIRMYMSEIAQIPRISTEEERRLGEIIQAGGEGALEARNKLVTANLRLVMHIAKKYLGRGVEFEDLTSMGQFGLIRAAEKYDYRMGFKFSTYACYWIKQAIARGLVNEGHTVKIPVHMTDAINKVKLAQSKVCAESGREATFEEIVELSGLSKKKAKEALNAMFTVVSMDVKIGEDGESTMGDFIEDETVGDPGQAIIDFERKQAIRKVLEQMPAREAKVLRMRFGIDQENPSTLDEIGADPDFGVTRERVRQIQDRALHRLRFSRAFREQLKEYA